MTKQELITLSKVQAQLLNALREKNNQNVIDRIILAMDYIDEMLPDYDDSEDENYEDECWEALSSIGDIDFNY